MTAIADKRRATHLGRYELLVPIGRAGGAEVHLARIRGAADLDRLVIVRVVDRSATSLIAEARRAARIRHPNVIDLFEVAEVDGSLVIASEELAGVSLGTVIEHRGKRLDELAAARIISNAAEGLDAAHDLRTATGEPAGFAHGHFSVDSVVVLYNGQVKVADFGVAPEPGLVVAPEVAAGAAPDRASDLYAVGVALWEALTLATFVPPAPGAAVPRASEVNANVPAAFDDILAQALAVEPGHRYDSGTALANDIEDVLSEARYARRNDRIAAFMTDAFAGRIAARRRVIQQLAEGTPLAIDVESAFGGKPRLRAVSTQPPTKPETKPEAKPEAKLDTRSTLVGVPSIPAPVRAKSPTPAPVVEPAPAPAPVPVAAPVPVPVPAPAPVPVAAPVPVPDPDAIARPQIANLPAVPPGADLPTEPLPVVAVEPPPPQPAPPPAVPAEPPAVAAVSLPRASTRPGTGGEDALSRWAVQSDVHETYYEDEVDDSPAARNRRLIKYSAIGLGVAALVIVVAFVFGRSGKGKDDPNAPSPEEPSPTAATTPDTPTPSPEPAPEPATAGSSTPTLVDVPDTIVPPETADPPPPPPPPLPPPAPAVAAGSGSAAPAPPPEPTPTPEPPKPVVKTPPIDTPDTTTAAKPDKRDKTTRTDKRDKRTKPPAGPIDPYAETTTTTATEPAPPKVSAADADKAYKAGVQMFARGDTAGALASLKTAQEGNPRHAPTQRMLGMVYEKMGKSAPARSAFRRYLKLAPNAGDAAQIRARLEKLK